MADEPEESVEDDELVIVVDKSPSELLVEYKDRYPCLRFRKRLMLLRHEIQAVCSRIIKTASFEFVTILVIVSNSIVLALEEPGSDSQESIFTMLDQVFLALYTVEMVLKILGLGFILNPEAYLRDWWNVLDFVIVISGYFSLSSQSALNLQSLRVFRVLRPLRAVQNVEGLRILVQSLISALPLLRDTIIVLLFFFMIFAIAGLQLFSGNLKQRCYDVERGTLYQ